VLFTPSKSGSGVTFKQQWECEASAARDGAGRSGQALELHPRGEWPFCPLTCPPTPAPPHSIALTSPAPPAPKVLDKEPLLDAFIVPSVSEPMG
jgi:hypothetical protein